MRVSGCGSREGVWWRRLTPLSSPDPISGRMMFVQYVFVPRGTGSALGGAGATVLEGWRLEPRGLVGKNLRGSGFKFSRLIQPRRLSLFI